MNCSMNLNQCCKFDVFMFRSYRGGFVDPLFTIGLHDETQLTPVQLKEQLLELLDIFLGM